LTSLQKSVLIAAGSQYVPEGGSMARVWQRIATVAFLAAVLVVFSQCKGLKPQPGGKCVTAGKYQCSDPTSALLCQAGTYVAVPCRGPQGCAGLGNNSACDDDLGLDGEACMMQVGGDNLSCAVDRSKEFICTQGKWTMSRTCKGPKKCAVKHIGRTEEVDCDDTFGDVGDPCRVEAGDNNYGCTVDKKTEVECDAASNKFIAYMGCRGQKGCFIDGNIVKCDQTAAREGEPCHPVDNHSCNEDATSELKCSPQFKWIKQRDCKHDGCKVKSGEVYCN
jgi:hypothetical protein